MSFINKVRKNKLLNTEKQVKTEISTNNRIPLINVVDRETYLARMEICNSCEHLFTLTKTCKKCGCFMTIKSKLQSSTCPVDKW